VREPGGLPLLGPGAAGARRRQQGNGAAPRLAAGLRGAARRWAAGPRCVSFPAAAEHRVRLAALRPLRCRHKHPQVFVLFGSSLLIRGGFLGPLRREEPRMSPYRQALPRFEVLGEKCVWGGSSMQVLCRQQESKKAAPQSPPFFSVLAHPVQRLAVRLC